MTTAPHDTWQLRNGTAWAFRAGKHLAAPVVLVGDAGQDLEALAASVDDGSYSLLAELKARGNDLVLVGLPADTGLSGHGSAVTEAVTRAIAEGSGERLAVGGTGRGALAARYGLASLEYQRVDHRTAVLFCHDAAAPDLDEAAELDRMGDRPQAPLFLRLVESGVEDGLSDELADETTTGEGSGGGALLSKEFGTWLLDRLPKA
ncbi:hypothetical protein [Streptomyces sp. NPDC056169]|uniref:hypothetical protein n=1 Tax=Streptomyces sp. NPDC056169 TaxID=3345734 RepID=UPI0035DE2E7A